MKFLEFAKGNSLKARLVRGAVGSAGVQAIGRVASLALGVVLARFLAPRGYGCYAYAFAIMSILLVFAEAGVPMLLLREVAAAESRGDWGLIRGVLRRGLQFVAVVSICIAIAGLCVVFSLSDRSQTTRFYTTALMLLVLPFAAIAKTTGYGLRGLDRVVASQALEVLLRPFLVVVTVLVVFLICPELRLPYVVMAVQLASVMLLVLITLVMLKQAIPSEACNVSRKYRSKYWLESAVPFVLLGGAQVINNQTDIIMLGWFTAPEVVGPYRVAVQGAALISQSLLAVNAVLAPQFARLHEQRDSSQLQALVTTSARFSMFAALPLSVAFMFFGNVVVSLVFGGEYESAHLPLAILAFAQLTNVSFGSVALLLNMSGHQAITARILWKTVAINVVLNVVLIPKYEAVGAAMASAFSLIFWNILLFWQAKKELGVVSSVFCRVKRNE